MPKFYYDEITKPNSDESDVGNFYNNTLPIYFPESQRYGIEMESRPAKEMGLTKKTDFTIRCIRNGQPKKVIVFENKAKKHETESAVWRDALSQAIIYVKLIRTEARQPAQNPIHIIIAVGTHLRAYTHNHGAADADDFYMYSGELLELQRDEEKVHELFTEINRITQH